MSIEILSDDKIKLRQGTTIQERKALGNAIADLYIKSQGICMETSNMVCEMMERFVHDLFVMYGFNEKIKTSEYNVRAGIS